MGSWTEAVQFHGVRFVSAALVLTCFVDYRFRSDISTSAWSDLLSEQTVQLLRSEAWFSACELDPNFAWVGGLRRPDSALSGRPLFCKQGNGTGLRPVAIHCPSFKAMVGQEVAVHRPLLGSIGPSMFCIVDRLSTGCREKMASTFCRPALIPSTMGSFVGRQFGSLPCVSLFGWDCLWDKCLN